MSAEARPRIHGCKVDEGGNTFDILPLLHNLNSIYRIILEYCSLANMATDSKIADLTENGTRIESMASDYQKDSPTASLHRTEDLKSIHFRHHLAVEHMIIHQEASI